jgi:hypothetical protein
MTRKVLFAAVAATLLAAAPATAATDYSGTLSASATTFAWDGGPGNGFFLTSTATSNVGCDRPGYDCETALLKLESPGALTVKIEGQGDNTKDIDVHLYASDAEGKQGKLIVEGTSDQPVETVSKANLAAGHYLVLVDYYLAVAGTYKGTATLKPSGAAAPAAPGAPAAGQPAANAAPQATINRFSAKSKASKLKGFSGTASDDKGVGRVDVGLVQKRGSRCYSLTASGKFSTRSKCDAPATWVAASGTTSWTFKLRRKLAKGKYVVFARATDGEGQAQTQFGPENRRAFTVKR